MDVGTIIEIVGILLTLGVGYGIFKNTVDNLVKEDRNQWKVITELRNWIDEHGKESAATRLELEREMGKLREGQNTVSIKLEEILRRLGSIDNKLDKMEAQ